jgi:hypothetical protein
VRPMQTQRIVLNLEPAEVGDSRAEVDIIRLSDGSTW